MLVFLNENEELLNDYHLSEGQPGNKEPDQGSSNEFPFVLRGKGPKESVRLIGIDYLMRSASSNFRGFSLVSHLTHDLNSLSETDAAPMASSRTGRLSIVREFLEPVQITLLIHQNT